MEDPPEADEAEARARARTTTISKEDAAEDVALKAEDEADQDDTLQVLAHRPLLPERRAPQLRQASSVYAAAATATSLEIVPPSGNEQMKEEAQKA